MSLAHDGTILLTGAAGFIGYHLADRLLRDGCRVVGVDSLNEYYDPRLKQARLDHAGAPGLLARLDLAHRAATRPCSRRCGPRWSCTSPRRPACATRWKPARLCRRQSGGLPQRARGLPAARHSASGLRLVSSVYGANTHMPFSVHDNVDHPVSLYAATKKANELMAHLQPPLRAAGDGLALLHRLRPWGRPTWRCSCSPRRCWLAGPIRVFNQGRMRRDFTYIDDIVEGLRRVVDLRPTPDPGWNGAQPDPGTSRAPTGSTISATTGRSS